MSKRIRIYGQQFTISGGENDDYYRHIPDGVDVTDSVMVAMSPHIADDAVCLDVGANIGLYTLGLSVLAPGGRIYAFEPSPSCFGHLRANLSTNRVGIAVATQVAVSDNTSTVHFHDFDFFSAGSFSSDEGSLLSTESYGSQAFEAKATTVDDFVSDLEIDRIDFIKIDVEGAELSVLAGAEKTLATWRPKVVLEFNTFGFSIHQSVLPQVALARLREIFPHVFVMDRVDGALSRLETPHEMYEFLYDNGIHGPADNLLCTFEDLDVSRRYSHVWTASAPVRSTSALAEAEAMRRTLSWRLTAPLRRARPHFDAVVPAFRAAEKRLRGGS